jgi:hypothetical protein
LLSPFTVDQGQGLGSKRDRIAAVVYEVKVDNYKVALLCLGKLARDARLCKSRSLLGIGHSPRCVSGIPGLVEVLREEGIDAVRYVLWDATGWHRDYSPAVWRNRATEEQKRIGWEIAVRMEKIICTRLHEAHERQVEEATDTLSEGPENFYKSYLD